MMRTLLFGPVVLLLTLVSTEASARWRCGGCSDPCGVRFQPVGYGVAPCRPCYPGDSAYYGGAVVMGGYYASPMACGVMPYDGSAVRSSQACVHPNTSFAPNAPAPQVHQVPQSQIVGESIPTTVDSYQVVLEPTVVTEKQYAPVTEYQEETQYRTRTIYRTIPVNYEDYRSTTVMVPKTETKIVEYTILVPETSQKTIDVVESVPVWSDVQESYVVKIPRLIDVPENYTVQIPTLRDEEYSYVVYVPQVETSTRMQTVTNAVPVTKTRTIQRPRPVTKTKQVTKDYGHWETIVEDVSVVSATVGCSPSMGSSMAIGGCSPNLNVGSVGPCVRTACRRCGGCGRVYGGMLHRRGSKCSSSVDEVCGTCNGCGTIASCSIMMGSSVASSSPANACSPVSRTATRQVWVPNVVTEEISVVEYEFTPEELPYTVFEQQSEQIPVEVNCVVMRPETRTGTRKVVDYRPETRTRMRKQVEYTEETRVRTRKELTYKQETKPLTYPFVTYRTEKRTKEITFTTQVPETKLEPFTATRYDQVAEDTIEEFKVRVPVTVWKETEARVVRMVPKVVPVKIFIGCPPSNLAVGDASGVYTVGLPAPMPSASGPCSGAVPYVLPSPCGCR